MSVPMVFVELHEESLSSWISVNSIIGLTGCEDYTEVTTMKRIFSVTETVDEIFAKINKVFELENGTGTDE